MKHILGKSISAIAVMGLVAACGGSSGSGSSTVTMSIDPLYLESLGDDFNYEGWIIVDGEAVSTGVFDMVDGEIEPSSFRLNKSDAEIASTFVLTIEPAVDPDEGPSSTHIIAGDFVGGVAQADTNSPASLNTDFADVAGIYKLATPSNGNSTPTQGIWYLDDSGASPVSSLTLPELPAGWKYEGWVVSGDGPISTGTFTELDMADSDGAGPAAGPSGTPSFPGQDFIMPALELVGLKAVISVEPDPDNSTAPFSIKPLVGDITNAETDLAQNIVGTLPSATVSIE